jgi:hypothetical protein
VPYAHQSAPLRSLLEVEHPKLLLSLVVLVLVLVVVVVLVFVLMFMLVF